jgi:hypothetical protein
MEAKRFHYFRQEKSVKAMCADFTNKIQQLSHRTLDTLQGNRHSLLL